MGSIGNLEMNDVIQALHMSGLFLLEHLLEIFAGIAVVAIRRWTGIQIEEKHMRALQSAVLNGVRLAIEGNLTGENLRRAAIQYIKQSVPDALDSLGANSEGFLEKLVMAKIHEVTKELPALK